MTDEPRPPRIHVEIETAPDFQPSQRLRAALDALDAALEAELAPFVSTPSAGPRDGDAEVDGYALTIGTLGDATSRTTTNWNDGCWGFSDGHCRWFQGKCAEMNSCTIFGSGVK